MSDVDPTLFPPAPDAAWRRAAWILANVHAMDDFDVQITWRALLDRVMPHGASPELDPVDADDLSSVCGALIEDCRASGHHVFGHAYAASLMAADLRRRAPAPEDDAVARFAP